MSCCAAGILSDIQSPRDETRNGIIDLAKAIWELCNEEEKTKLGIFNERPLTGASVAVGGLLAIAGLFYRGESR
jgi:hypothetical protein